MDDSNYTRRMVTGLIETVEKITGKPVPRSGDHYDDLITAKLTLADRIAEEMGMCEKDCTGCKQGECEKFKQLWHEADRLQNLILRDGL